MCEVDTKEEDMRLKIRSFWTDDREVMMHVDAENFPSPNIVRPAIVVKGLRGTLVGLGAIRLALKSHERATEESVFQQANTQGSANRPGSVVGVRVQSPIFMTPYLPYLQAHIAEHLKEQFNETLTASAWEEVKNTKSDAMQLVMPDITLQLVDGEGSDSGSHSIALQDFRRVPQGLRTATMQLKHPKLANLKHPVMRDGEEPLANKRLEVNWRPISTVFVDVFAAHDGYLTYDDDMLVGTTLTDHDLFYITLRHGSEFCQLFNADDYFLGWKERQHSAFSQPPLRAANMDYN
eukprot:Polyplicarium_translucidae@DN4902_c0_g1_i1.p1